MNAVAGDSPTVSVLIVNYNGLRFMPALLDSLQGAFARHLAEVIVVDNASSDGSAQWLRSRQGIRLIEPGRNTGFTGGNNLAAQAARGRVLLLLNNDTEVHERLDRLVDAALPGHIGAAGCRINYGDGRLQHSVGLPHTPVRILLSWLGFEKRSWAPSLLRKVETDAQRYGLARSDVAWVSGACLATRRELWESLGGLDERLFMYCEDVDYCSRLRERGLSVVYLPAPAIVHHEASGRAWVGARALLRTARSYFIIVSTSHGALAARFLSAALSMLFAMRACIFFALGCASTRTRRALLLEKARGFASATSVLFRAGVTGAVPELP